MAEMTLRVLLVEDDEDDYLLVRDYLDEVGGATLALEWAATYEAGLAALARREHDVALIDYRLGAHNGLDLLHAAGAAGDLPPAIVLTGAGDPAVDAAAQTAGAFDFLVKGRLDAPTLERSIRHTLDQSRQRTALAGDQQFLQATLDALSAHIAVLDERSVVVAVNAAWRRFGADNDAPVASCGLGMDYLAVCDAGARDGADGAAAVGAAIRDLFAGERASFEWEYPCHGPDERRWFTIRIARFSGEGPTRIVVAHENVSAQHRAEERSRFQVQLLDQVPAAVIATDLAGLVTHWNAQATTLYGWTPTETLGRPLGALTVGPSDVETGRAILERVVAGEVWAGEFPVRRKDGTSFPAYVTDAAIRDEQGRTAGIVGVSVDISDRKAAETALVASEARYRMLLEQASDGILVMDPTARFTEVNAQACAMLGYAREELLALGSPDVIDPADLAERPLVFPQPGPTPTVFERRLRRRDGTTFPAETSIKRLPDGGTQAILRDITARKAAETELREVLTHARCLLWRAAITERPAAELAADSEQFSWSLQLADEAAAQHVLPLDIPPGGDYALAWHQSRPAEDFVHSDAMSARALREGVPGYRQEFRCQNRHGGEQWLAEEVTLEAVGPGRWRAVGICVDITARKTAEAELRANEARFRAVVQQMDDVIAITDAAGIVRYASPAIERTLGYTPAAFVGTSIFPYLHPDDHATVTATFNQTLANPGIPVTVTYRARHRDGSWRWFETSGTNLLADPAVAGVVINARDITARVAADEALRASEHSYRELMEQAADAIFIFAPDGHFLTVNARACALTGYECAELLALEVADIMPPEEAGTISTRVAGLAEGPRTRERLVRRKDGVLIPSEVSAALLDDGRVQIIIRDNTERKLAEAALRASEASLAEAQRVAHLGSWEYDYATKALHWSDEVFRIGGFAPRSFVPTPEHLHTLIHPDDRARMNQAQRAALATGVPYDLDHRIVRPDGEIRTVHQQAEIIRDETGRPLKRLGIVQDVTERRLLEGQLRHQAFHDALTGLPNRALLFERIGQALSRARRDERPCAVLFLDLDRFKDANDTAGHDTGDRLLIAVAARLGETRRDGDTLARLGGDEFTLLLEDVEGPSEAVRAATRILETLVAPLVIDDQEYRLTASIGIALSRPDHRRPEEVLRDADIAMYRAKDGGRAAYALFDPAMQEHLVARLELERDLRRALDRQEFTLYYQPIVELRTGYLTKVEALVRWQHPTRGLVSPGDFIPLAEEAGLIRPLGRWVLGEACRQAATWAGAGTPTPIAVNLTAQEFQHPGLADEVATALAEAGLAARWLGLEITESLAMRDVAATIATLGRLQALGVAVAIDDFGTGYSSLAYLKRLPVHALKIDKTFIDGLGADEEDTAIVAAIVTLGQTLGLHVVAEGVGTAAQAALLRRLGCDQAQGYHFARPLPADAVAELLAREALGEGRPGQGPRPGPTTGALRPRRVAKPRPLLPDGRGVASD